MSSQLEGRFEVLGAYLSERESDLMPIIIGVDQFRDQHAVGLWQCSRNIIGIDFASPLSTHNLPPESANGAYCSK
jgi:hypothetical protein